jgi:tRNA (guanine-N7-)-methyltransferase
MNLPQEYLPHVYREPLWCSPALPQAHDNRVIVEVGPGRGDFLFHLAQQHPQSLVCGIELMHERFEKLIVRRDRHQLENIMLIQGDARRVLPEIFHAGIHEIHIHFSDPWPKRKHFKNRLIQPPFIAACAKTLLPGGFLYFTTDWPDYSEWTAKLMSKTSELQAVYDPVIQINREDVFPSYFCQKWIAQGRKIQCQKYLRLSE